MMFEIYVYCFKLFRQFEVEDDVKNAKYWASKCSLLVWTEDPEEQFTEEENRRIIEKLKPQTNLQLVVLRVIEETNYVVRITEI